MSERRCTGCAFAFFEDYGYSNYTTLGTNIHCLLALNPRFPCEDDYSWQYDAKAKDHEINRFAESCQRFKATDAPLKMDCDHEDEEEVLRLVRADPERSEAWDAYMNQEQYGWEIRDPKHRI